jgi:polyisoprenoid-binding protein YceI
MYTWASWALSAVVLIFHLLCAMEATMLICKPALRSLIALAVVTTWSSPCAFQQRVGSSFAAPDPSSTGAPAPDAARYRIDAAQSRFTVRAFAGGFLSAFAHDHNIAIRDIGGEANFSYGTVEPASLRLTIKADSLAVTDKIKESDREKIETTMRNEVLEVAKHPEITFKSSSVSATKTGDGQYQARIPGDLTLHGVTRPLTIAAQLEFGDKTLRAKGAFALKQSSFEIKPVSVAGGTIKVKDELKFTFEIVARP